MSAAFDHLPQDKVESVNKIITAAKVLDETIEKHFDNLEGRASARAQLTKFIADLIPQIAFPINFEELAVHNQLQQSRGIVIPR